MTDNQKLNPDQREDRQKVIADRKAIQALNGYLEYAKSHTVKATMFKMMNGIINDPQTKGDRRLSDIILTDGGDLTPPSFNRLAKLMAKIWYGSIFPYSDSHDKAPLPKAKLKSDIDHYLKLTPAQLKADLPQMAKSLNGHLADDKQSIKDDANLFY